LLFSSEQLVVAGRGSDFEAQGVGSGSQVVSADFEGNVLECFAAVTVVKVRLEVEDVGGGCVEVDGNWRSNGLTVDFADSGLVVEGLFGSAGADDSVGGVAGWGLDRSGFIAWSIGRLGHDGGQEDKCKEQNGTCHMSYNNYAVDR
jgi:hypothetical protein